MRKSVLKKGYWEIFPDIEGMSYKDNLDSQGQECKCVLYLSVFLNDSKVTSDLLGIFYRESMCLCVQYA